MPVLSGLSKVRGKKTENNKVGSYPQNPHYKCHSNDRCRKQSNSEIQLSLISCVPFPKVWKITSVTQGPVTDQKSFKICSLTRTQGRLSYFPRVSSGSSALPNTLEKLSGLQRPDQKGSPRLCQSYFQDCTSLESEFS